MSARRFVLLCFMGWSIPLTTDDEIFAFWWTFLAFVTLMVVQRRTWKFLIAKLFIEEKIWSKNVNQSANSNRAFVSQLPDIRSATRWQLFQQPSCATRCSSRFQHDNLDMLRPCHAIDHQLTSAWSNQRTSSDPWRTRIRINEMKENKKWGRKVHQFWA